MEVPFDPNLIVGLQSWSDAGVYKLSDDLAIVQTVDFFTPIVDDPFEFGRIAVANALSDVYAMGGRPITAMNLVCFPTKTMDITVLREILRGGMDKLREAEVTLVGGHSVDDPELKFGLSVTGIIHPQKVITNAGAIPGDALILTKPIGTGIINTAIKAGMAAEEQIVAVIEQMAMLNRKASELMQEVGVHACTDITGFGLLGHASEIVQNSRVGMKIKARSVPIFTGAIESARKGLIPGGTYRNRDFRANMVEFAPAVPDWAPDILFDPQTSGGLLIAVSQEMAPILLAKLHEAGCAKSAVIGKVIAKPAGKVLIR